MPLQTASDILRVSEVLGADGFSITQRLFPQFGDPLKALGAVAGSGITCVECGDGLFNRTIFRLTSREIAMTDEAGVVAYGGSKIYDFPPGHIVPMGAWANLTVVKSGDGINADFDGDFGLGVVTASNNATLATTEQNFIPTTAMPQASSGATTAKAFNSSFIAPQDGTSAAIDLYLNFLIDDADQDITGGGASSLLVSGLIVVLWANMGNL